MKITANNAGTTLNISFYHLEQRAGKYHSQELENKKKHKITSKNAYTV